MRPFFCHRLFVAISKYTDEVPHSISWVIDLIEREFFMLRKPRRAMWLMNHSTLRKFEVPILESLGYEVFLPKLFPYDEGNLSASLDYSRDASLSIPSPAIELLNKHDFYSGITPEIAAICNEYFDIALCGYFPPQLAALIRSFKNVVVMRPFGLSDGDTYTNVTASSLGLFFMDELESNKDRYWFGQAYDHLADIESGPFKRRAITLPLGLDDARITNEWTGKDKTLLFVCPRIGSSPYFNSIYKNFKASFADIPHRIGGAQPIAVRDPTVTGHLPRLEYDAMMRDSRVMFYHSRETRHLHYHPLEAVRLGMPLVFMAGGMLDKLGGSKLPGRAKTISEAKRKIARILDGDRSLISAIRTSQGVLLKTMSRDYCEPLWREAFAKIEASLPDPANERITTRKRIAVILPEPYLGGTFNMVKLLAKMTIEGARHFGSSFDVVFAYPDNPIYKKADFSDLVSLGIELRPFKWQFVNDTQLSDIVACRGYRLPVDPDVYSLPRDGSHDLLDCDFWLVGSDRFYHPIAPLKPYCLFAHDYLQRYVPNAIPKDYEISYLRSARAGLGVLANTPHTIEDAIQYAGIPRHKAILVPHVAELDQFKKYMRNDQKGNFFIWTTNTAPHKNHIMTLEALARYYDAFGGKLDVHVTGVGTERFDPSNNDPNEPEHILMFRQYLRRRPRLAKRIKILGNVSSAQYVSEVRRAQFLLHNVLMDNGTLCSVEAAYAGTPTLSSDYPPMRYISERYKLNVLFFDKSDSDDLSRKLHEMDSTFSERVDKLPSREFLESVDWESHSYEFFQAIRRLAGWS